MQLQQQRRSTIFLFAILVACVISIAFVISSFVPTKKSESRPSPDTFAGFVPVSFSNGFALYTFQLPLESTGKVFVEFNSTLPALSLSPQLAPVGYDLHNAIQLYYNGNHNGFTVTPVPRTLGRTNGQSDIFYYNLSATGTAEAAQYSVWGTPGMCGGFAVIVGPVPSNLTALYDYMTRPLSCLSSIGVQTTIIGASNLNVFYVTSNWSGVTYPTAGASCSTPSSLPVLPLPPPYRGFSWGVNYSGQWYAVATGITGNGSRAFMKCYVATGAGYVYTPNWSPGGGTTLIVSAHKMDRGNETLALAINGQIDSTNTPYGSVTLTSYILVVSGSMY